MKIIKVNEQTNNEREFTIKHRNTAIYLFGMVLGCFMLAIGYYYLDDCQNGVANWLLTAGILELAIQTLIFMVKTCQKKVSSKVGKEIEIMYLSLCTTYGIETPFDTANSFAIAILVIVELGIFIWGSEVVFGAWTRESPSSKDYCAYTPMMTAFIILIIKYVIVLLFILDLFSNCCDSLCDKCEYLKNKKEQKNKEKKNKKRKVIIRHY